MVTRDAIKDRAVMMGVETGTMPELEYIWEVQRFEGQEACFGRGLGCADTACRWRKSCLALSFFISKKCLQKNLQPNRQMTVSRESNRKLL